MFPRSVGRVTDLPPDAKLRRMQQNSYRLMQRIGAATPKVPNQTPMPQISEQLLHSGPIPSMHIIALLPCGEPIILPANEWHNDTQTAFVGPIMAPNLKIKKLSSCLLGKVHNHPISIRRRRCRGPRDKSILYCPTYQWQHSPYKYDRRTLDSKGQRTIFLQWRLLAINVDAPASFVTVRLK